MCGDLSDRGHIDDCILFLERREKLGKGVGVGDTVDFDVGREGSSGGGARKNFDVACEAGVGVEGGEDGGADVAGSLRGVLGTVNGGGGVTLYTPMTMMFLRIDAIPGTWNEWPRRMLNQMRKPRESKDSSQKRE